jgi:hypothetical protein
VEVKIMKALSVIGLLLTAAIFATIPISPQVTPRGVELSVDQAQAITYGRYRRVYRRSYRRAYYGGYYPYFGGYGGYSGYFGNHNGYSGYYGGYPGYYGGYYQYFGS